MEPSTEEGVDDNQPADHNSSSPEPAFTEQRKRKRRTGADALARRIAKMAAAIVDAKRSQRQKPRQSQVLEEDDDDEEDLQVTEAPTIRAVKKMLPGPVSKDVSSHTSLSARALVEFQKEANCDALLSRCSDAYGQGVRQLGIFRDPFSGASDQDFDHFLKQFEIRAVKARWRDADKVVNLLSCLDGAAADAYLELMSSGSLAAATFPEAVQQLRALFPRSTLKPMQAMKTFMQMVQRPRESVSEFANRFRQVLRQASVDEDGSISVGRWCDAVRREFKPHLLSYIPDDSAGVPCATLAEVIAETVRIESCLGDDTQQVHQSRKRSDYEETYQDDDEELGDDVRPQTAKRLRPAPTVRAIEASAPATGVAEKLTSPNGLMDAAIVHRVQVLCDANQAVLERMQQVHARQLEEAMARERTRIVNEEKQQARRVNPITCYGCGANGHIQRHCPNQRPRPSPQRDTPGFRGPVQQSSSMCNRCGRQGHVSRDCRSTRGDYGSRGGYERNLREPTRPVREDFRPRGDMTGAGHDQGNKSTTSASANLSSQDREAIKELAKAYLDSKRVGGSRAGDGHSSSVANEQRQRLGG